MLSRAMGSSGASLLLAGSLALAVLPAQAQPIRLTPPGGQEPAAQQEPAPQLTPPSQTNTMPAGSQPLAPPAMSSPVMPPAPQAQTLPAQQPVLGETPGSQAAEGSSNPKAAEFVIQPLNAPDPSSGGLLDDSNGGLGTAMW